MSDKITIELQLEPALSKKGKKDIEQKSEQAGKRSGKKFEKGFSKSTEGIGSAIKNSIGKVSAVAIGVALVKGFKDSIRLATIQEDAVTRLNNSLRLTGELSRAQSDELQEYASSLQRVSRFGDEVILNNLALAKSYGATNEQAKQILDASVDLASVMGIDLQSAVRNISKTIGGYSGELGESIPQLKALTKEQLQAGAGIDLIAEKFKGQGRNLDTYGFATDQLSNSFGDLLESIGQFITKNPLIISSVKSSADAFNSIAGGLNKFAKLLGLGDKALTEVEKIDRTITKTEEKIKTMQGTAKELEKGGLFSFLISDDATLARVNKRIGESNLALEQLRQKKKRLLGIADADKKQKIAEAEAEKRKIERTRLLGVVAVQTEESIREASRVRFEALNKLEEDGLIKDEEAKNMRLALARDEAEQMSALRQKEDEEKQRLAEAQINRTENIAGATRLAFEKAGQSTVQLGKTIANLAVQGYGNAFKNIGIALKKGEGINKAFEESTRQAFANVASASGDYYILEGGARIAKSYGADATGYKMVGIGTALKVLGGYLGSDKGGGGVSSGGGSSSGAGATGDSLQNTSALEVQDVERGEPQTNVEVVVQGSLVQQEELGTFLAETLSESFGKQGVSLTDARFT
jgi:hypothetical protein